MHTTHTPTHRVGRSWALQLLLVAGLAATVFTVWEHRLQLAALREVVRVEVTRGTAPEGEALQRRLRELEAGLAHLTRVAEAEQVAREHRRARLVDAARLEEVARAEAAERLAAAARRPQSVIPILGAVATVVGVSHDSRRLGAVLLAVGAPHVVAGDRYDVFRRRTFVGRVVVERVFADSAQCRVLVEADGLIVRALDVAVRLPRVRPSRSRAGRRSRRGRARSAPPGS